MGHDGGGIKMAGSVAPLAVGLGEGGEGRWDNNMEKILGGSGSWWQGGGDGAYGVGEDVGNGRGVGEAWEGTGAADRGRLGGGGGGGDGVGVGALL